MSREAEAAFLLGNYMELVDIEVTAKQKELLVGTVKGVLRAKVGQLTSRAAPEINFPQGWLYEGDVGQWTDGVERKQKIVHLSKHL